jgi:hypothetical protein
LVGWHVKKRIGLLGSETSSFFAFTDKYLKSHRFSYQFCGEDVTYISAHARIIVIPCYFLGEVYVCWGRGQNEFKGKHLDADTELLH